MGSRLSPGSVLSWLDATLATFGDRFIRTWSRVERSYRRPLSRFAFRLKFAFYPLLALGALAWLGWDWTHDRTLNAAENAIFDQVVNWRPVEPVPSGRVVVVEIDECSIEYFRAQGEGGWPWRRQRHADLLDRLDRAGALVVGYDVLFADRSQDDPAGDQTLEMMAAGGDGRFVFAATRMHPDYDEGSPLRASQAPSAFSLAPEPQSDPKVALLLPYGEAMARHSAIVNVARNEDGVLRDIPVYEQAGDWALPSLPLRLSMTATGGPARTSRGDGAAELARRHAIAEDQRRRPSGGRTAGLPRCNGGCARLEWPRRAGRLYGLGAQRCQADAGGQGDAGCRGAR